MSLQAGLNAQQKKAVTHVGGPLLIVAGAGTGKTTVITKRMAWLMAEGLAQPHEILALTFTEKAAAEMEERLDHLLPYGYVDLWVQTFHAFAEKLLQRHALDIGLPHQFKLYNTTDQWLLMRQNLDRFGLDYYRPLGNPTKFISALARHFSRTKDENINPQQYLDYAESLVMDNDGAQVLKNLSIDDLADHLTPAERQSMVVQEIAKVKEVANAYHVYQQLLLEHGALDFGDLINYLLRLLQERPKILAQYRKQFKYILVDEFQDTNHAQYELIKLLAAPANNITVVGDDDQAIYKFRGASLSNILEFKADYPTATEVFLTHNYRSSQNILDMSYKFIQLNNPDRLEVKLAVDAKSKLSKKLKAHSELDGVIQHLHFGSLPEEVNGVVDHLITVKQTDAQLQWSDFAILVRANDAAQPFIAALQQMGVPYQFMASRGLYNKNVVLDLLAYLRLLHQYHENHAMYRVLLWPCWELSSRDISQLGYWSHRKGYSMFEMARQSRFVEELAQPLKNKLAKVVAEVDKHTEAARQGKGLPELLISILEDTGYLQLLTKDDSQTTREQATYLNQFYKRAQQFHQNNDEPTVAHFLEEIQFELDAGEHGALATATEDGPDTVKIMTIHASKGLEFMHVYVANMVDRRFPTSERSEPIELPTALIKEVLPEGDAHLQEERRLFYVAMTRAKRGLYFTSAVDYGGSRAKKISRFLAELKELGYEHLVNDQSPAAAPALGGPVVDVPPPNEAMWVPTRFSFTQLKAYETCPYQYRFAHILRLPIPGKAVFSFGKTMHATLQKFFQLVQNRSGVQQGDLFGEAPPTGGPVVSLDELLAIYKQVWIDDWYKSRKEHDEYWAKGQAILKSFYEKVKETMPVPVAIEQGFSMKLHSNKEVFSIGGQIDRIDDAGGKLELIDYKTGKPKAKLEAEDKEQLLIYQMAISQIPELASRGIHQLTFFYLDDQSQISFTGKPADLEKLQAKMLQTIKSIHAGDFTATPGPHCKFCDFYNICEYRSS